MYSLMHIRNSSSRSIVFKLCVFYRSPNKSTNIYMKYEVHMKNTWLDIPRYKLYEVFLVDAVHSVKTLRVDQLELTVHLLVHVNLLVSLAA